jgi:hypothetical protein
MEQRIKAAIVLGAGGLAFLGLGAWEGRRERRLARDGVEVPGRVVDKFSNRGKDSTSYALVGEYAPGGVLPPLRAERAEDPPQDAGRLAVPPVLRMTFRVSKGRYEEASVFSPIGVRCLPSEPSVAEVERIPCRPYVLVTVGGAGIVAAGVLALLASRSGRGA